MFAAETNELVDIVGFVDVIVVDGEVGVGADKPSFAAEADVVALEVNFLVSAGANSGVDETGVVDEPVGFLELLSLETAVATVKGSTLIPTEVSDEVAARGTAAVDKAVNRVVVVVGVIVANSVVVIPVESNENDGTATIVIVVTAASNDVAGFVGVRDVALAFAIGQVAFVNA